jgi:hypothetical protein
MEITGKYGNLTVVWSASAHKLDGSLPYRDEPQSTASFEE